MSMPFSILDVFAEGPFQGTPVPVVLAHEKGLTDSEKTLIAAEFQQSETVFFNQGKGKTPVSVYNGKGETGFGAHTLLAAAYTAYETGLAEDKGKYTVFQVGQNNQLIDCFIDKGTDAPGEIQFARKLQPTIDHFVPQINKIARALNTEEKHITFSKYRPMVVSIDRPTLIVPFTRAEHVLHATLDEALWQDLLSEIYATEMLLFSPRASGDKSNFHGRLIHPGVPRGVFPPIGNVLPEFIAYLAEQKETSDGTHTFTIDRGSPQTRTSLLHAEFDKRTGKGTQCRIGGKVIKMAEGTLLSP